MINACVCEVIFIFYLLFKLQMIPDDLLDQLNKLKYLERATSQIKEFKDQVIKSSYIPNINNSIK